MLGSTLLGFCAILPGKKVKIGDTWSWKGDLLNIGGGQNLVAKFKLQKIIERDGQKAAVITGRIDEGWPEGVNPKAKCRLVVSLKDGAPLEASFDYTSKSRTQKLRTTGRWVDAPVKTKTTAQAGK